MSSHTLEGKKKTQNGVKRLMFTVLFDIIGSGVPGWNIQGTE